MKLLSIHCKSFFYSLQHSTHVSESTTETDKGFENCLAVLFSIEKDDTTKCIRKASQDLIAIAAKSNPDTMILHAYPHLSTNLASAAVAKHALKELKEAVAFIWSGTVVTVPFGWYSSLNISTQSHKFSQSFHSY